MMGAFARNFTPYEGEDPYLHLCFSEGSAKKMLPLLGRLRSRGVRVWYCSGTPADRTERAEMDRLMLGARITAVYLDESFRNDPAAKSRLLTCQQNGQPIICLNTDGGDSGLSIGLHADAFEVKLNRSASAEEADFSGFHPPELNELWIANAESLSSIDLSSVSACPVLKSLDLDHAPIGSLQFLSDCSSLETLALRYLSLRRLDGIENLKNLVTISLQDVDDLADISALEGCTSLEQFRMTGYPENVTVSDLSALGKLPHLYYVSNVAAQNTDLDFLKEMPTKDNIIFILVNLAVTDYSGLAAINSYDWIYMNMDTNEAPYSDAAPALRYLQDKSVNVIHLRNAINVDLSMLSHLNTELSLETCDVRDFTTLNENAAFRYMSISDCRYLQSLDGIEKVKGFSTAKDHPAGVIYFENCPHLTNWSALDGMHLEACYLIGLNTLPDFSVFTADTYYLEGFPELHDLSCFEGLDPAYSYSFDLSGLEGLTDISALYKLKGKELCIRPEWREQAEELVASGIFESYEVNYPDTAWQPDDSDFTLLSLDELDKLPKSVLARVRSLCMAGDIIYDENEYHIEEDWNSYPPALYLCRNDGDDSERVPVGPGSMLTDLSTLKDLTGLRQLRLYMQPLETLSGIQYLESLETLTVQNCGRLTDITAAFTLQNLNDLSVRCNTGVSSIAGIQNLYKLEQLNLDGLPVNDLSPLLELPGLRYLHITEDLAEISGSLGDDPGFEVDIG